MPNNTYKNKIESALIKPVDINSLKCSNTELKEASEDYAHAIIETVPNPLLVLDRSLRVVSANKSFYNTFKLSKADTKGKLIYELENHKWDISELRTLLEKVHIKTFNICRNFLTIGQRTILVNASQIYRKDKKVYNILLSMEDISGIKKAKAEMARIEWILTKRLKSEFILKNRKKGFRQVHGKLIEINNSLLLVDSLGKDVLLDILADSINLLESSAAIYDREGDYTLGFLTSGWCRLLNSSSGTLSSSKEKEDVLRNDISHCHKCWAMAAKAILKTGEPSDFECPGGLHIYALPIRAGEEIIGCINFGYGDPPKEPETVQEIASKFMISEEELLRQAEGYESRPPFIIEIAKSRLFTLAELVGAVVEHKMSEEKLRQAEKRY